MEEAIIEQTTFDQLVGSENNQMLKAAIPYFPFSLQKILAAYAKTQELYNTIQLFSKCQDSVQICSATAADPLEMITDIKKFSYGTRKKQLDHIGNILAMIQVLQIMNE